MSPRKPYLFAIAALLVVGSGCKDQEARDQLKKAKSELSDTQDDLMKAQKQLASAQRDLEEAKAAAVAASARVAATEASARVVGEQLKTCLGGSPGEGGKKGCNEYFSFMDKCLPRLESSLQSSFRSQVDTMKRAYSEGDATTRGMLDSACSQTYDAVLKITECSSLGPTSPPPRRPGCNCDPTDPLCGC